MVSQDIIDFLGDFIDWYHGEDTEEIGDIDVVTSESGEVILTGAHVQEFVEEESAMLRNFADRALVLLEAYERAMNAPEEEGDEEDEDEDDDNEEEYEDEEDEDDWVDPYSLEGLE